MICKLLIASLRSDQIASLRSDQIASLRSQ